MPDSTWTQPPSWSVLTNSGTPRVAAERGPGLQPLAIARVAVTPSALRPVRITLPTW